MLNIKNLNRWQAFLSHLALSVFIFLTLLAIILNVWYPGVFFHFGATEGIKIVAGVDLILGPVLTLVIFNPKKATRLIALDLTVIGVIQASALSVGVWLVYEQRPALQVLSNDAVYVYSSAELKSYGYSQNRVTKNEFSPPLVALDLPKERGAAVVIKTQLELVNGIPFPLVEDLQLKLSRQELKLHLETNTGFKWDKVEGCFQAQIESSHYSGQGCFSPKHGLHLIN